MCYSGDGRYKTQVTKAGHFSIDKELRKTDSPLAQTLFQFVIRAGE